MKLYYVKHLPLVLFVLISQLTVSLAQAPKEQNLVLNYSMENYERCPEFATSDNTSYPHRLIPGWTYPTEGTTDYFNQCSHRSIVDVPSNFAGMAPAKTGYAYMGLVAMGSLKFNKQGVREYLQGELAMPLEQGQKYCVSFYYRLSTYSKYSINELGLYFSKNQIIRSSLRGNLPVTPDITTPEGQTLDNKDDWEHVCAIYTAKGDESFFIIGNFRDMTETKKTETNDKSVNKMNRDIAYYYIDDVSIVPLKNCRWCPCVPQDLSVKELERSYTGGVEAIKAGKAEDLLDDGVIELKIEGGTPPYSIEWTHGPKTTRLENLSYGTYSYIVRDKYNCVAKDTIIFIEPDIPDEFTNELKTIKEGGRIILKNIFFDLDKTDLKDSSYVELDKLANFIIESDIKEVVIEGHTDSQNTDAYNYKLSEGRAKAVIDYLVMQGVERERLSFVGYGESRPIATNQSKEGRAKNRRVEFVLKKR